MPQENKKQKTEIKSRKMKIFYNEEILDQPFPPLMSYEDLQYRPQKLADINKREGNYFIRDGKIVRLYSNIPDSFIFDFGSNVLLKEGGSIKFTSVPAPPACVANLITAEGNLGIGNYSYRITYVTAVGETNLGAVSNTITTTATQRQVLLTSIPISPSRAVIARRIYRTEVNGTDYYLLATINDNTTTTYTDNVADDSLIGGVANDRENDTFGKIIVEGRKALSLGFQNTLVGQNAGYAITTGYNNVAVGGDVLYYNTTGSWNVGVGGEALRSNTTGSWNVGVGGEALRSNTTGSWNVGVGGEALRSNTTGDCNVGVGDNALYYNTTGIYNVGVGNSALRSNTTGNYNVGVGGEALWSNTTGSWNVAIGNDALMANSTGHRNVAIGCFAGRFETGSDKLFIDNRMRANEADARVKALIYGEFASATADQMIRFNSAVVIGGASTLPTTATKEFLYIPTMAGIPTGTPVSYVGKVPMVYDTTNNRLYIRSGGVWRYVAFIT